MTGGLHAFIEFFTLIRPGISESERGVVVNFAPGAVNPRNGLNPNYTMSAILYVKFRLLKEFIQNSYLFAIKSVCSLFSFSVLFLVFRLQYLPFNVFCNNKRH